MLSHNMQRLGLALPELRPAEGATCFGKFKKTVHHREQADSSGVEGLVGGGMKQKREKEKTHGQGQQYGYCQGGGLR